MVALAIPPGNKPLDGNGLLMGPRASEELTSVNNSMEKPLSEGMASDVEPLSSKCDGEAVEKEVVLDPEEARYHNLCDNLCPRALFYFTTQNPLRKRVIKIVKSKMFDQTVLLLILVNCLFLAMDSKEPNFVDTPRGQVLSYMEYFFTVAFVVEMLCKIVCLGFVFGRNTYLRDGWNGMDFTVVMLGLLPLVAGGILPSVSALRTVRVLRPLRTMTRVEGMRKLVVTLLQSLPMLMDVCVLVSFMFLLFGIVGVILFAGKLRNRCYIPLNTENVTVWEVQDTFSNTTGLLSEMVVFNKHVAFANITWEMPEGQEEYVCAAPMSEDYPSQSLATNGRACPKFESDGYLIQGFCHKYQNPNYDITSYDHIGRAWLTIFQCISLEGWVDVMYWAQDGVSKWVWIYFLIMIVFVSFFAVNLMLAVLYVKFTEPEEQMLEDPMAPPQTPPQEAPAEMPEDEVAVTSFQLSPLTKFCHELQAKPQFEMTTMILIVLNTITMASEYHGMPGALREVLEYINYILAVYFLGEMIVKMKGLGIRVYVKDRMNVFDALVVFFSMVEIVSNQITGGSGGSLSVLRTFRLLRVFKLARSWKQLNDIIRTIFKSLASIAYLSLILLLFMFIFALLGMQLFGYALEFCDGYPPGVAPICPEGESCPKHRDCYAPCTEADLSINSGWMEWPESGAAGLCVKYPIDYSNKTILEFGDEVNVDQIEYLARLGKVYVPRHNFDDIFWSVVTIFQILTGENWNSVMYDGIRGTSELASLYFILLVVIGNYIILNLFLAILLDNFGGGNDDDEEIEEAEKEAEEKKNAGAQELGDSNHSTTSREDGGRENKTPDKILPRRRPSELSMQGVSLVPSDVSGPESPIPESPEGPRQFKQGPEGNSSNMSGTYSMQSASKGDMRVPRTSAGGTGLAQITSLVRKKRIKLEGNALFCFSPENPIRKVCAEIVQHKKFEFIIIVLICVSSIILAVDSPNLDQDGGLKLALDMLDKIFVVLFSVEMVLKIITTGFAKGKTAYLKNSWNILDFCIVLIGLVGWIGIGGGNLSALRALRTFRALRPIRVASRAEGMKVVVNALFQAIPGIANVVLVCFLFYLIFGILGLNLFMGKYYFCMDEDTGEPLDPDSLFDPMISPLDAVNYNYTFRVPITKDFCENNGTNEITINYPYPSQKPTVHILTKWKNPDDYNFDNIAASMFALFEMATLEGWLDVMYSGIDSVGVDEGPVENHNKWSALFFLFFIVVGSFFVMNLFVGVTIDKFNEMKEKQEGQSVFLTEEQRGWVNIQKMMMGIKPSRSTIVPDGLLREVLYHLTTHEKFDMFIMSCILLNVVVMSLNHVDETELWDTSLTWANNMFTMVFTMEAVFKLIALFPRQYFRDNWNNFDFVVVVLSLFSMAISFASSGLNIPGLNMLRIFRVARIFRLIPKAKGLRTLFHTLMVSLPALANVGSVLFLFFFIFSSWA